MPQNKEQSGIFLTALQNNFLELISKLKTDFSLSSDQILTPATFINDPELTSEVKYGSLNSAQSVERRFGRFHELFQGADSGTLSGASDVIFDKMMKLKDWIKFFSSLNVLPISTYPNIFIHDIAHLISALINPYEELVLAKKFYDAFSKILEITNKLKINNWEEFLKYGDALTRYHYFAIFLFEQGSIPNLKEIRHLLTIKTLLPNELDNLYVSIENKKIISYEKAQKRLKEELTNSRTGNTSLPLITLLNHFKNEIKLDDGLEDDIDSHFFTLFNRYGGDSYDLTNLYKMTSFSIPTSLDAHLESLYWKAKRSKNLEEKYSALLGIFTSFYNTMALNINFKKIVDDIVESHQEINSSRQDHFLKTFSYIYFKQTFPLWSNRL